MRKPPPLATGLIAGFVAGSLAFAWPFGVSDEDVATKLMEHRTAAGADPREAACHQRPGTDDDWWCEVREGADDPAGLSGYEEYIVRRSDDRYTFARITDAP